MKYTGICIFAWGYVLIALVVGPGCRHQEVRLDLERAIEDEKRASVNYDEAQDRLQAFEEEHFEYLMGMDGSPLEAELQAARKKQDEIADKIRRLEGRIQNLELSLSLMGREIVKRERTKNPEYEAIYDSILRLRKEIDALLETHGSDHPVAVRKTEIYEKRKAELKKTRPLLKDEEIRKPNPRWEENKLALKKAQAELDRLQIAKLEIGEKIAAGRERLKRLPMIRGQHRKRLDAVDRANEALKDAARQLRMAARQQH